MVEILDRAVADEPADAKEGSAADDADPSEGASGNGRPGDLPAFPGAEGFGAYAKSGRGGRVIEVTTLEDYDPETEDPIPGSLRAGLNEEYLNNTDPGEPGTSHR